MIGSGVSVPATSPAGVATPPLVVARAKGALIWDADGREYLDFAGGIGCQNLGHGHESILAAIHEQVDSYLHQSHRRQLRALRRCLPAARRALALRR